MNHRTVKQDLYSGSPVLILLAFMSPIVTVKKVVFIIITTLLFGCAPHFYHFEMLDVNGNYALNQAISVKNKRFENMHLQGNHILINAIYEVVNNSDKVLHINNWDFKVDSQKYNYSRVSVTPLNEDSEKETVTLPLLLAPKDTITLKIVCFNDKKIKENDFIYERLNDTISFSIKINEQVFTDSYRSIESKKP